MTASTTEPAVAMRLDPELRRILRAAGFVAAVTIAKDVSVVVPGAVESVFRCRTDAVNEAARLSGVYNVPDSFVAVTL